MNEAQIHGLVDDHGTPIRWKVATLIACAGLVLVLVSAVSSAGAKSERLDTLAKEMEALKLLPVKMAGMEGWKEDVSRRLISIEESQKESRADQKEILREVRRR
jgi:hypothetical protein